MNKRKYSNNFVSITYHFHVKIFKYISLFELIRRKFFSALFTDIIGSIAVGNPVNSYIIAGEIGTEKTLLTTIFMIARITVGVVQLPSEIYFFGKNFSIARNILSFIFALVGGYIIWFLI